MNNSEQIVVSVFMMTYNHEKYIAQAIESVLMQKTNYRFNIVLGEDCSTDTTRDIVLNYANNNPGIFKLILHERNVGAKANHKAVLEACEGKYIAMLEGDDYWTDPNKLQKQVDFLEANPEYIACAHETMILNEDGRKDTREYFLKTSKRDLTVKDFLASRPFHTNSIVFNKIKCDFSELLRYPDLLRDIPFFIIISTYGKIRILSDCMSVYRLNSGGLSAKKIQFEKLHKEEMELIQMLNKYLPDFYFASSYMKWFYSIIYPHIANFNFFRNIVLYVLSFRFFIFSFYCFPKNIIITMRIGLDILKRGLNIKKN